MKKIIFSFSLLVVLVISSLGLNSQSASAAPLEKDAGLSSIDSPESYINFLEDLAKTDKYAAEGLESFKNLSLDEQQTFLLALQPENYSTIIGATIESPNIKSVNIEGNDIPVEVKIDKGPTFEVMAPTKRTVTATYNLAVNGVRTTTLNSTVVFNYLGGSVTQLLDNYGSHSNINPAMIWSQQAGRGYIDGGDAYGRASWTVYATGGLGFINDSVDLIVRADGYSRSYKVDSSRTDWRTNGWRSF